MRLPVQSLDKRPLTGATGESTALARYEGGSRSASLSSKCSYSPWLIEENFVAPWMDEPDGPSAASSAALRKSASFRLSRKCMKRSASSATVDSSRFVLDGRALENECLCSSQASAKVNHFQRDEQFFAIAAARKKNPKSQRGTYPAPPRREQKAVRRRHRKRIRIEKEKKAS